MKWYRVWTVTLRHLLSFRDFHRWIDLLYWPTLDIMIWGFSSAWLQGRSSVAGDNVQIILLSALILWQIMWRTHIEIGLGLVQEIWSLNIVNLFSTPLHIHEWISGLLIVGFLKTAFSLLFGLGLVWILYGLNLCQFILIPFIFLCMLSGWITGILSLICITIWGRTIDTIIWPLGWVFNPFCGVFYPVSALPFWVQKISWILPPTYIFEGMRQALTTHIFPYATFATAISINILYLSIVFWCFWISFQHRKQVGLASLEQ